MSAPAPPTVTELDVRGTLPLGLSGRLITTGTGAIRVVHLDGGRAWLHEQRRPPTATDADLPGSDVLAVGSSILAVGHGTLACELSPDLDGWRAVDLAGHGRALVAWAVPDPRTGELHVVATDAAGTQWHVVVSPGALTRRSRSVDVEARVTALALTRDHVVFATDRSVGVAPRAGEGGVGWVGTATGATALVHASDAGDTVVLLVLTPSLEQWTVDPAAASAHRRVLDRSPWRAACVDEHLGGERPRHVWTTGRATVGRHDLATSTCTELRFWPDEPGDLVLAADAARAGDAGRQWLIGFVRRAAGGSDLAVLDAADVAGGPVATVAVPGRLPRGLHGTWIPGTARTTPPASR